VVLLQEIHLVGAPTSLEHRRRYLANHSLGCCYCSLEVYRCGCPSQWLVLLTCPSVQGQVEGDLCCRMGIDPVAVVVRLGRSRRCRNPAVEHLGLVLALARSLAYLEVGACRGRCHSNQVEAVLACRLAVDHHIHP
jgi:hypothetical protein